MEIGAGEVNAVYLEITTWQGISLGATHYYGKLVYGAECIELTHSLTATQAAKLGRLHDWTYREGDRSPHFDMKEEIIELALSTYKEHFPDAYLLVLGKPCYAEPQPILDGPSNIKARINQLCERIEAIGGWEQNYREMGRICDEWETIIEEL